MCVGEVTARSISQSLHGVTFLLIKDQLSINTGLKPAENLHEFRLASTNTQTVNYTTDSPPLNQPTVRLLNPDIIPGNWYTPNTDNITQPDLTKYQTLAVYTIFIIELCNQFLTICSTLIYTEKLADRHRNDHKNLVSWDYMVVTYSVECHASIFYFIT